jgi:hypothetical protein
MIGWILFIVSLLGNFFLIWYLRELLQAFFYLKENFDSLDVQLNEFTKHTSEVLNRELFFDDPVIKGLLKHAEEISEEIKTFRDRFDINEEE